jgi:hypothetical protein
LEYVLKIPFVASRGMADRRSFVAVLPAPASAALPVGIAYLQLGWQTVLTPLIQTVGSADACRLFSASSRSRPIIISSTRVYHERILKPTCLPVGKIISALFLKRLHESATIEHPPSMRAFALAAYALL